MTMHHPIGCECLPCGQPRQYCDNCGIAFDVGGGCGRCRPVKPGPGEVQEPLPQQRAHLHATAVKREGLSDHFRMFARNGRWGTCSGCPRDSEHVAYPEFCEFTIRYDHWLTAESLAQRFASELRDQERLDDENARLREARARARQSGAHVPDGDEPCDHCDGCSHRP